MQFYRYRFQPKLIPTLATILALPILVSFGVWQSNKAQQKQALQDLYDVRSALPPERLPTGFIDTENFRYKKIIVRGRFDPKYQILLDNRINNEQAGYHVITPFQIEGSEKYILINRGWIPLGMDRSQLPNIATPQGMLEVIGIATLPPSKIYELMKPEPIRGEWQTVWQNMDLKRYREAVPFQVQPIIVQMDKDSEGGFMRVWPRPDNRIETHLGYAFQWFGMAVMLVLFYLIVNIKKIDDMDTHANE